MAKLIAIIILLALTWLQIDCDEHAHQSVARLKRNIQTNFHSASHSQPQLFDIEQKHIEHVPDEQQQKEPENEPSTAFASSSSSSSSSSSIQIPATENDLSPLMPVAGHIIKDSPANKTRGALKEITVSNCGTGPNTMRNLNRIVNGTRSGPGMFPWQVYLKISTNQGEMLCGGSILNENWILTAAHCISSEQDGHYTATAIEIVAGALDRFNQESSKQKAYADCAFKHPNWRGIQASFANDIALIRISRMSGLRINGNTVQGICIPPKTNPRFTYSGPAIVSGWGLTTNRGSTSRSLQYAKINVISYRECLRYQYPVPIIDSMICQGLDRSSPCQGDSGGPLTIFQDNKWVQYGLVSFGPGICNNGKIPNAVYTQLSAHMTWMENTIASYSVNPTCSPRRIAIS